MSTQLYTVTLTDLGTYQLTVAAESPKDAERIAKAVLLEEAATRPKEMRITKRESEGTAEVAAKQPVRTFQVRGTYSIDVFLTVPAASKDEAERHARRLYGTQPFPWEHETADDRIQWHLAREMAS